MKTFLKSIGITLLILITLIALEFGLGFVGVFKTKIVHKFQENAEREVFEQTQSYVSGKRQEALKLYREYQKADPKDKSEISEIVIISFADFDETKLNNKLEIFIHSCKYGE